MQSSTHKCCITELSFITTNKFSPSTPSSILLSCNLVAATLNYWQMQLKSGKGMVMMKSTSMLDVPVHECRKGPLELVSWNSLNWFMSVWNRWRKESRFQSLSSADWESMILRIMNLWKTLSELCPTTRKAQSSISSSTLELLYSKAWTPPKTERFLQFSMKRCCNCKKIFLCSSSQ